MRKILIAGNWKMNKLLSEAHQFVDEFLPLVMDIKQVEIVLCPPYTCLGAIQPALDGSGVFLGAQDLFWEEKGAFTGEISAGMLADAGCRYVIVGHSERRHIMGETDHTVNRKLKAALNTDLVPILCVGETAGEREGGRATQVVGQQLRLALDSQTLVAEELVIAYEPVWAIGTGINATHEDAQHMCRFIRHSLTDILDREKADRIRILYGGSVTAGNIGQFLGEPDIDGVLVGGASLKATSLAAIIRVGENGK